MSRQYLRKVGLTVVTGEQALDLSEMHIQFNTTQMDVEGGYPPSAWIRVYNLTEETARQVQKEYQRVILQAGYEGGDYGAIFDGTIKHIRKGRLSAKDSFLDISAADGDLARYAVVNDTLKAGWNASSVARVINNQTQAKGLSVDEAGLTGGVTGIRGKVLFGLAFARADDLATNQDKTWSIVDGKMVFTSMTGYRAGEVVVLNAGSGLLGVPESTIEGIQARCLLNPKIKMGSRVQIDNGSINQTTVREAGFPRFGDRPFFASVTADGVYRVMVAEHVGDNRGQEWETQLVCLALDPSASPTEAVSAYGDAGVPAKASSN